MCIKPYLSKSSQHLYDLSFSCLHFPTEENNKRPHTQCSKEVCESPDSVLGNQMIIWTLLYYMALNKN